MGFITNQWLLGNRERRRGHHPIKIKVGVDRDAGFTLWERKNEIVAGIRAERADEDYQMLYLRQEDVDTLLPYLIAKASGESRAQSLIKVLKNLDDDKLLNVLFAILSSRNERKNSES